MIVERERRLGEDWVQVSWRSEVKRSGGRLNCHANAQPGRHPPDDCSYGIITLGELVTRRSHHERPERCEGRLGPEKR